MLHTKKLHRSFRPAIHLSTTSCNRASPHHLMASRDALQLRFLVVLLVTFTADATLRPKTLHVPVVHRDAVFPPRSGAPPGSHRRYRHAAPYTAQLESFFHSMTDDDDDDRLRSSVMSGVPLDSGEYFAVINVGDPPTRALVVIDTGSDLIWFQCVPCRHCYHQVTPLYDPRSSSTHRRIPCASPRCRDVLRYPGCDDRTGGCVYMVVYGDGSASSGDLATDRLVFPNDTHVHNVTLGCGHDNGGLLESAAGLLGVGRGKLSFPTQLAPAYGHVFSYCFGDRLSRAQNGSSYLVFGRTPELPATAFTPLRTNPRKPSLYYVDMVGFSVGGERVTGFPNASLALDPVTGRGGVVVDSGTAVSRFDRDAYAAVRDAFDSHAAAAGMRKPATKFSVFDTCYDLRGSGNGTATAAVRVPSIVLHFAGGADMALPVANYLIPVQGEDRRMYFCLGLQAADDGLNVLGNVQQQGFGVVFDVEWGRIGFTPNGC